jgi:hypothetical protein
MDFAVPDTGGGPELAPSRTSSVLPSEKWAFNFKNYTIDHQGLNTLNIKVDYGLKPGILAFNLKFCQQTDCPTIEQVQFSAVVPVNSKKMVISF